MSDSSSAPSSASAQIRNRSTKKTLSKPGVSMPALPEDPAAGLETESSSSHHDNESFGVLHYLPLIFAVIPPLLSVFGGTADIWTDVLLLMIVCFYLYQIVKVPWELYYSSRQRRISAKLQKALQDCPKDTPEYQLREEAIVELRRTELFSLAMTLLAPFIGSYMLHWIKPALSQPDRYINPFSIRLFCFAAGIKPFTHFFSILKRRSLHLHSTIQLPPSELEILIKRVARLEGELQELKKSTASRADVRLLRDAIDAPLTDLVKAVRRHERKGEYMRVSAEERFDDLDTRVETVLNKATLNDKILHELQSAYSTRQTLTASVHRLLSMPSFKEEGLTLFAIHFTAFLLLLPVTLPISSCTSVYSAWQRKASIASAR